MSGSNTVAKVAQFCVAATMAAMNDAATATSAPCESTAPVANVNLRPAAIEPVPTVMVESGEPVEGDVMVNAFNCESNKTSA